MRAPPPDEDRPREVELRDRSGYSFTLAPIHRVDGACSGQPAPRSDNDFPSVDTRRVPSLIPTILGPSRATGMKIAVVHDYLREFGGAEKVLQQIMEIYPSATLYTSYYLPERLPDQFASYDIRTTYIQHLPFLRDYLISRSYIYLFPRALAGIDLDAYDCIISSTSGVAKWIRPRRDAVHISYVHQVPRFLYYRDPEIERSRLLFRLTSPIWKTLDGQLRKIDLESTNAIDTFIANSYFTAGNIAQVYKRKSLVIYPPVDVDNIVKSSPSLVDETNQTYFLTVGRRSSVKELHLAIHACNQLGYHLKIVGRPGNADSFLRRIKGPTTELLDDVNDDELMRLRANCRAFISPGLEDFGIAAVEALAAGKPVIARRFSGSEEIVTGRGGQIFGRLFHPGSGPTLTEVLEDFRPDDFDSVACQRRAQEFDAPRFQATLLQSVESQVGLVQARRTDLRREFDRWPVE
jgi:glycosyltransferase involved in cell wall biosynthesis